MSETSYQITADSGCDLSLEKCREIASCPIICPSPWTASPWSTA